MSGRRQDSYILSALELGVLMRGMGKRELYGFDLSEVKEATRLQTVEALRALMEKGLLSPTESGFKLENGLKRLLHICTEARSILRLLCPDEGRSDLCCYIGGIGMVAASQAEVLPSGIRLEECSAGKLCERLELAGYLPKTDGELACIGEKLCSRLGCVADRSEAGETLRVEICTADGRAVRGISIYASSLEFYIVSDDGGRETVYTSERFKTILNEMIREGCSE